MIYSFEASLGNSERKRWARIVIVSVIFSTDLCHFMSQSIYWRKLRNCDLTHPFIATSVYLLLKTIFVLQNTIGARVGL